MRTQAIRDRKRIENVVHRIYVAYAKGAQNVLLWGPPGSGATMIARRVAAVLPSPTPAEQVDLGWICRVGARLGDVPSDAPFRAPHHTVSAAGLLGATIGRKAGPPVVRPGEVSLAHRGLLFLDELPEFSLNAINRLAVTLDQGTAQHGHRESVVHIPARPQLVVAHSMPCPCGYFGVSHPSRRCDCAFERIERYQHRATCALAPDLEIRLG